MSHNLVKTIQGQNISPVTPTDGYVLTYDTADGYWVGRKVTGGGYITALDFDFTAQTTQTLSIDTNYTIGGLIWTKINSANDAVAMTVTNGVGLVQKPSSSTNISSATRTAPGLFITLPNAGVPSPYLGMKIRIWGYVASTNAAANFDTSFTVLESGNSNNLSYMGFRQWNGAGVYYGGGITNNSGTTNTAAGDTTNTGDNVFVIEAEMGSVSYRMYSGVWSSGWPNITTLRLRDAVALFGTAIVHTAGSAVWDALLAAGRAGSGTPLNITWGQLRIDYNV